jgi:hypothetical protein
VQSTDNKKSSSQPPPPHSVFFLFYVLFNVKKISHFSIMTSSPSPDISSLSLSSSNQQRLHDSYDYEGNNIGGNSKPQYHFQTSPPMSAPSHSQYNPLAMTQSPIKKPVRGGLPVVSAVNRCKQSRPESLEAMAGSLGRPSFFVSQQQLGLFVLWRLSPNESSQRDP